MARSDITVQDSPGTLDYDGDVITWTANDGTNGNSATFTGAEMILARNDNAGAQVCTVTSVADAFGRTRDASFSVPAGAYRMFGPFKKEGWNNGGKIDFDGAAVSDVFFAVIRIVAQ